MATAWTGHGLRYSQTHLKKTTTRVPERSRVLSELIYNQSGDRRGGWEEGTVLVTFVLSGGGLDAHRTMNRKKKSYSLKSFW